MHPPEVNEPFEQPDDSDYSLIYDEEDSGIEALSAAAEIEALGAGKLKITDQPCLAANVYPWRSYG
jgi:hypothetical protein